MDCPRPLVAAQISAVVLTIVLVAASIAAVWLDKGVRFFEWGAALGPLCVLISVFDGVTAAWTITWERNKAVKEFKDREGEGS